ncbi:MAG: hypothetical protein AAGM38_17555 [Pseudomonadota bacterium]
MTRTVSQMDEITQKNAQAAERSAARVGAIAEEARALMAMVEVVKTRREPTVLEIAASPPHA